LKPADIDDLSSQQFTMLSNAANLVRPDGRLVYSTCSVEVEENEDVIKRFLGNRADFVRVKFDGARELQTEAGAIRTWPHRQGVDAFFISGFRRTG
jgi:16S rRNA (cytosine967-C5)-methyltransferase